MLIIRLQRTGRRNRPEFRLVLMEKRSAVKSAAKEIFGSYNPRTKSLSLTNQEKLKTYLAQNTEVSPSAHNLLVTAGVVTGPKVKSFSLPPKKQEEVKPEVAPEAEAKSEAVAEQAPSEEPVAVDTSAESVEETA